MKAKDRLKLLENIISKVGMDGPVLEEYTKSLAILNSMQSMNEAQPVPPVAPPMAAPVAPQPGMPPQQGNLPPLGEGGLETPQMA